MMKIPRRLAVAGVPAVLVLTGAGPALAAAPSVGFRVEAASRTLLDRSHVTVPASGSITKGGTPSGTCPADSAAGALNVATHGNWGGTYSSGLGVEVTNILGTTAQYGKGSYWEFFVNDRAASKGVCDTKVKAGDQFLFAQVPAKGTEYPLVVSAPRKVAVDQPFDVRTYYYTGKGNAKKGVSTAHYAGKGAGKLTVADPMTAVSGAKRLSVTKPGTLTLTVSARGEIRSAPVTITVTK